MDNTAKNKKRVFPKLKKSGDSAPAPTEEQKTEGNVFTDLFDKEKEATGGKQDDIVDSVVKKSEGNKSVLGPKPKVSDVKVEERPISFGGSFMKLMIFLLLVLFAGGYAAMGSSWSFGGANFSVKSDELVADLKNTQAEFNTNNYLVAYYYLDSFAYLGDSYIYKYDQYDSDYISLSEKTELAAEIVELEEDMILALEMAQERLNQSLISAGVTIQTELTPTVEFKEATISYIEEELDDLETGVISEDSDVLLEIRGLQGALALLQNGAFVNEVLDVNTEDGVDYGTVSGLITDFSTVNEDNFTIISQIKTSRMEWSEIIKEIEEITKEVDPLYGTSVESDINYASYSLESEAKSIVIQGGTSTDDTRSFTLISNLIDALEQSSMFANIENRSFSKTESSDDNDVQYESSFRLSFEIQEGEDERDATFTLEEEEEEEAVSRVATEEEEDGNDEGSITNDQEEEEVTEEVVEEEVVEEEVGTGTVEE